MKFMRLQIPCKRTKVLRVAGEIETREREKKKYVVIDGLGSKDGRAHCHNSAQMMNSEPVKRERERGISQLVCFVTRS